jgi:hypothetical protein
VHTILLEANADPSTATNDGKTPKYVAAENGEEDVLAGFNPPIMGP